ncbi:hypothetical protein MKK69_26270 [Methylobacterium sp. J-026]|nr:hypothetical protein [Methylobacterium sp. J-026]MCJ2137506.1 hypothetical protein [Methylobacterium sp. J-026]
MTSRTVPSALLARVAGSAGLAVAPRTPNGSTGNGAMGSDAAPGGR